jgi:hypothetical protein
VGVGDQAVAADFVAREVVLVDEQGVEAGAGERLCAGAAGGAGADHEHVAGGGQFGGGHSRRGERGSALILGRRWLAPFLALPYRGRHADRKLSWLEPPTRCRPRP